MWIWDLYSFDFYREEEKKDALLWFVSGRNRQLIWLTVQSFFLSSQQDWKRFYNFVRWDLFSFSTSCVTIRFGSMFGLVSILYRAFLMFTCSSCGNLIKGSVCNKASERVFKKLQVRYIYIYIHRMCGGQRVVPKSLGHLYIYAREKSLFSSGPQWQQPIAVQHEHKSGILYRVPDSAMHGVCVIKVS